MDIKVRMAKKDDAFELSELFVEFIGTRSNIEKIQYQLDLLHKQPNYYVAVACLEEKVGGSRGAYSGTTLHWLSLRPSRPTSIHMYKIRVL